ncbi:MAG: heme o synthase [Halobacterium sp.]
MSDALPRQLYSLVKPRIVALLCVTGAFAALAAGGAPVGVLASFLAAGALVAGGSAALNCWYDRRLDRHMERTADRPLPSGRLDHRVALAFAVGLLAAGAAVGAATLPRESVAYMLAGAASYVGLYTVLLKRRHWLGVVLGGSAGSFPVLAGWTAVRPLAPEAVVLAAVVFAWTPAHAWALATVYREDFAAAGVPTLPVVASRRTVRRAVWTSALATVAVAAAAVPLAPAPYAVTLAVAGGLFLAAFRAFHRDGGDATAVGAFFASNLFLAVLFVAWGAGGALGGVDAAGRGIAVATTVAAFACLWRARPALRGVDAAPAGEYLAAAGIPGRLAEYVRDNDHPRHAPNSD